MSNESSRSIVQYIRYMDVIQNQFLLSLKDLNSKLLDIQTDLQTYEPLAVILNFFKNKMNEQRSGEVCFFLKILNLEIYTNMWHLKHVTQQNIVEALLNKTLKHD